MGIVQRPKALTAPPTKHSTKTSAPSRIDRVYNHQSHTNAYTNLYGLFLHRDRKASYVRSYGIGHRAHTAHVSGRPRKQSKFIVYAQMSAVRGNGKWI